MTLPQWIFTYKEICKNEKEKAKLEDSKMEYVLDNISLFIDLLALVVDKDNAKIIMDIKEGWRDKKEKAKNPQVIQESNDNEEVDNSDDRYRANEVLTETDAELLNFFDSLPEFMEASKEQENTGRFVLPTVNLDEIRLGMKIKKDEDKKEGEES